MSAVSLAALTCAGILRAVALSAEEPYCSAAALCTEDVLSLRFAANGGPELGGAQLGDQIEVEVFLDVKSAGLQGFLFAVEHDSQTLELLSASWRGADPLIEEAGRAADASDIDAVYIPPGRAGFLFRLPGVGPDFLEDFPQRDGLKVARARYRVKALPPLWGARIRFSGGCAEDPCPLPSATLVIAGRNREPASARGAVVKQPIAACALPDYAFFFGSQGTHEEFDLAGQNSVAVSLRNAGEVLGFSLGIRQAGDKLTFESTLGSGSGREIELVITKIDGTEVSGPSLAANSARGARGAAIVEVARGSDLVPNSPGDFLGVDLVGGSPPAVGGPGVTVGYVADVSGSGKTIPAVSGPEVCPVNEVLRVRSGHPDGFSRADANGDGKINLTDAVVIAQNLFAGKYVFFDCQKMLDVNDDGRLTTEDPVLLQTYIFLHGPRPAVPFQSCGADPTPDSLACNQLNC